MFSLAKLVAIAMACSKVVIACSFDPKDAS